MEPKHNVERRKRFDRRRLRPGIKYLPAFKIESMDGNHLYFTNGHPPCTISPEFKAKHDVQIGGYMVVHEEKWVFYIPGN